MSHPAAASRDLTLPVVVAAGGNASVAVVCDGAAVSSAASASASTSSAPLSLSPSDFVVKGSPAASVSALAPFRVPEGTSDRSVWIATVSLPPPFSLGAPSSGVVSLSLAPGAAGGLARARAPLSFRVPAVAVAVSSSPSSSTSPPKQICGLVETTMAEVS